MEHSKYTNNALTINSSWVENTHYTQSSIDHLIPFRKGYGHSIMNFVYLLIGLVSLKRNSEEGPLPPCGGGTLFLAMAE